MSEDQPVCCDFCFNHDIPLYQGGFDSTTRICAFCATRALAEITPQPVPEPAPPPERLSREARLASIPSPKSLVTHLDQFVIGQNIAKRRLALGVSNHFKRLVDCWERGAPDPIVSDPDLHNVRIEKSNILLICPSGSGKTHLVKSLASYVANRQRIASFFPTAHRFVFVASDRQRIASIGGRGNCCSRHSGARSLPFLRCLRPCR